MRWCKVQTNEYDLRDKTYPIICTHHKLHTNNENKFPFPRNVCAISDRIWCKNISDTQPRNKANLRDLIAATGQVISNWIQIVNISARVTVKFDGWPRKTIGHFYTTSSFVHHFTSIGEFKLDLQSGNAQFGSKLVICYPVGPWNLTLENNRAPLLCYFKLCAAFRSHWGIQTGVTVRKRPIWVKFDDF